MARLAGQPTRDYSVKAGSEVWKGNPVRCSSAFAVEVGPVEGLDEVGPAEGMKFRRC